MNVAVNVFHHHDGVIHQDADGEDQREQRHPVESEAPGPGGEQGDRQGQDHRRADDERFAPAQRQPYQPDHERGSEDQLGNQGHRLVVGGDPVIAGDGDVDAFRDEGALELFNPLQKLIGDLDRVLAGLLGDGERHGGEFTLNLDSTGCRRRPGAQPDVAFGRVRTEFDLGDIGQIDRRALVQTHHQTADFFRVHQKAAGLHWNFAVVADQRPGVGGGIGGLQRTAQVAERQPVAGQLGRIESHLHYPVRRPDGVQIAGARHALQLGFQGVGHPRQIVGAPLRILGPQRQTDDGHVVNALRFDDGLTNAQIGRQPVGVGIELVVQPDDGVGARLADQELHG